VRRAVVVGLAGERDELVVPPDFVARLLVAIGDEEQHLDLDLELAVNDQLVAILAERDPLMTHHIAPMGNVEIEGLRRRPSRRSGNGGGEHPKQRDGEKDARADIARGSGEGAEKGVPVRRRRLWQTGENAGTCMATAESWRPPSEGWISIF
jgi:hypothetical protein